MFVCALYMLCVRFRCVGFVRFYRRYRVAFFCVPDVFLSLQSAAVDWDMRTVAVSI